MPVKFVLGKAGSGKTSFCLQEIRQLLQNDPKGPPIIMIVPEQATFETEHALVTAPTAGGMIRTQVLSFRRLAYRVLQETGGNSIQAIDETGKKMLLYRIMEELKSQLSLFHIHAGKKGWMDKCYDLFTEWRRYQVTPEVMQKVIERAQIELSGSSKKLSDLCQIYEKFVHHMHQGYLDAESRLDLLAAQLKQSELLARAQIYIDGFHGFTPQELCVVGELMQHCENVVITLCVDQNYNDAEQIEEWNFFYPTASTLLKLKHIATEVGVETEVIQLFENQETDDENEQNAQVGTALSFLHRHYGTANVFHEYPHGITVRSAGNRRTEVEMTAREILRLVREEGCRWRDVLVMIRQPDDYADLLRIVFAEHDIPCFIDEKMNVDHHPLVEFIRSALEVVRLHWRYDSIFRCVKTDFLLPVDADKESEWRYQMDILENYVLAFGIQGARWLDGKPWTYRFYSALDEDIDEQPAEEDEVDLTHIHQLRQRIVRPLLLFQKRLLRAQNVREQTEAIYQLLVDVEAQKRLELWSEKCVAEGRPLQAKQHVQVWNSVMQVFDQMVEVMGQDKVSLELLEGILETGFEHIQIGMVPPSLDQVMIGSIDRSRSSHRKHCFLLGLNDGVLPAPFAEDGLLTESERDWLQQTGIELAPGSRRRLLDEQFLIYTLLTIPTEGLWLSYPLADEEGKALLPSEIIRRLQQTFPKLEIKEYSPEPYPLQKTEEQMQYIHHPKRTLAHLSVQMRNWLQGIKINPIWWNVYNWYVDQEQWRGAIHKQLKGLFYRNQEPLLQPETSRKLYGTTLQASVSRMETFVSCPFAHFMSYGLRLKKRRVFKLEAPDIGQLFHASLNWIAKKLQREGQSWSGLSEQDCKAMATEAIQAFAPRLQGEILFSSNRYHYITHKLKQIISRTVFVLSQHAERGNFTPVGLELIFGRDGVIPPLRFDLDNGFKMEVSGRIDRVDMAEVEQGLLLRVIDYKSSQTYLQLSDVFYGLSLQILAYLDVVVTYAEEWLGKKAIPAGGLYFHIHDPLLSSTNPVKDSIAEKEYFKQFKMRGWILSDVEIVKAMDFSLKKGHSEIIPVALKANGDFYKTSSVFSQEQWSALQHHVRLMMKRIGTEITKGNVEVAPYRLGKQTPCNYCPYKSVCQFNPNNGEQYRYLSPIPNDYLWTRLMAEMGGVCNE